jgi:aspartate ammonia-lyase
LSFKGSDGREYINELCFSSMGEEHYETYADKFLSQFKLNALEEDALQLWSEILETIEGCKNFNQKYVYGVHQIEQELNTFKKDENGTICYDYPELNTKLNSLKTQMNEYYEKYILPKLFKYELLK